MNSDRDTQRTTSGLVSMETADELYREYDFKDPHSGDSRVYRIDNPATVEYQLAGTTHRVTDQNGVTHILPAPGFCACVVRFKMRPDAV